MSNSEEIAFERKKNMESSILTPHCQNQALKSINVNIWDFLDAVEVGTIPQMFLTKKELVKYTWKTGRIFPRDEAKDMGPVAALLKMLR